MEALWKWNESLETDIEEIDNQHRALINYGNKLVEEINSGKREEAIGEMLNFLGNYIADHFKAEEKLQLESGYPGYEMHKTMHHELVDSYNDLKRSFQKDGVTPDITFALSSTIYQWLVEHIGIADKAFADFLKKT